MGEKRWYLKFIKASSEDKNPEKDFLEDFWSFGGVKNTKNKILSIFTLKRLVQTSI